MALFGDMPIPVQFFLAFVIVLGLIGATAWLVRRFGAGALGGPAMRGRQPRLAVLEHTLVEGRRRLYLVRRDNVEHLLLIGGPTDIVVEPNIVRAAPAAREAAAARQPSPIEALPRAIPMPQSQGNVHGNVHGSVRGNVHGSGHGGNFWPLQPEPAAAPLPPRPLRNEPPQDEPAAWPLQAHAGSPPRTQRDTLSALADELSTRQAPGRGRPAANARPPVAEPRSESRAAPVQSTPPEAAAATDQALVEMANRLEAALRRPAAKADGHDARTPAQALRPRGAADPAAPAEAAASPQAAPAPSPAAPSPVAPAQPDGAGSGPDPAPPRPDDAQPNGTRGSHDSLEKEMASLLGRPTPKN